MFKKICYLLIACSLFCFYHCKNQSCANTLEAKIKKIMVKSTAFKNGGIIPKKYTCSGENISPPLSWSSVPDGTMSLALICDDPDAPGGTFVHWVIFNIPPDVQELEGGIETGTEELEDGTIQGTNDFGEIGYGGPCPPSGTHRYYFKLYALDTQLDLDSESGKPELISAMKGHILAKG